MGQIVAKSAKPRRANLQAIQVGGSLANTILPSGEYLLIDSTNGKVGEGYGKYDKYIIGDGTTPCASLTLYKVDDAPDADAVPISGSVNPVQSGGVYNALSLKQNTLTFDVTPVAGSPRPVTSGGIYTALQNIHIDVDDTLSDVSENPLQNKVTKAALDLKADQSTTYTKTEIDTALSAKANQSTTYTKTEVNNLIPSIDNDIIIGTLPASGEPNTIYRVPGTNSYTDYAWDGTQFIMLATFDGSIGEGGYYYN